MIMIVVLNHRDRPVAEEIDRVQKESYSVEAALIKYDKIPYLLQSVESIQETNEVFLGYRDGKMLAGVLSYEKAEDHIFDICRLVIKPGYFGRGIGQALVREVENLEKNFKKIYVQTAKDNLPALNLYYKLGYEAFKEFETPDGLKISRLVKMAAD
jgi:ribosomal protein S18 acetylase RimI-like enzyme